jgi:hypothetical protein
MLISVKTIVILLSAVILIVAAPFCGRVAQAWDLYVALRG